MQKTAFMRVYVLLRPVGSSASGYARLEVQHGRGRVTLHVSQAPAGCATLRVLLLSGGAEDGSLLDLGLMPLSPKGCGTLRRENIAFPASDGLRAYHTLLLATDWPEPVLMLTGALDVVRGCPLWQLQEALRHYLAVPPAPQPTDAADPPMEVVADASCPAPMEEPPVCLSAPEEERSHPPLTVHCLPPLIWPEAIAELKVYFDTLPPFAPFDAPGWRFVRVPLPGRNPAPYCAVGIRMRDHQITEVAYALPGQPGTLPPGGLRGYRWQAGRNGQGYWTLWQGIRSA